jgi:hypothetical protein
MAGFEGPRDPGAGDKGASKLPSWAVTRSAEEPDTDAEPGADAQGGFADVRADTGAGRAAPRVEPPVVRVPEHPFDIDDPFGDKQLGGTSSPWIRPPADDTEVRVVDLADEFHLTTAQALEVCAASGTPAASGAAWLTLEQAAAFRAAVATYDRSESSGEEYPSWAIPPGGRRRAPDTAVPDTVIPGATLLAGPAPDPDDDDTAHAGGRVVRILLLVVAIVVIVALVALLVRTILAR